MDQISRWKEKISDLIQGDDLTLYDIKWVQDGKQKILQVSIMDKDGNMDIDTCAEVSNKVSDMLDEEDSISFAYMLEVCSPGAERELRNEEEIKSALNQYVFIKFVNPKDGMDHVQGTLVEVNEEDLCIEYMDKTRKKKLSVLKDNMQMIRLAVKL